MSHPDAMYQASHQQSAMLEVDHQYASCQHGATCYPRQVATTQLTSAEKDACLSTMSSDSMGSMHC